MRLRREGGTGPAIEGAPPFRLTARHWTSEGLDAAGHTPDLVPGDTLRVDLDHAQHGIGSQSCGPGVLPRYRLEAAPVSSGFTFTTLADGR